MYFLHTTWMVFWRVLVVVLLTNPDGDHVKQALIVAAVAAPIGLLSQLFQIRLLAFPFIKMITVVNDFIEFYGREYSAEDLFRDYRDGAQPYRDSKRAHLSSNAMYQKRMADAANTPVDPLTNAPKGQGIVRSAFAEGVKTGYEPQAMFGYLLDPLPQGVRGVPGSNIPDTKKNQTDLEGKIVFAKALKRTGVLEDVDSWWAAGIPTEGDPILRDDSIQVDCIIRVGMNIYLIDIKSLEQGAVTYSDTFTGLICVNNTTNQIIQKYPFSEDMKIALERYTDALPANSGFKIKPRVLLMPSNRGMGSVSPGTEVWGIPVVTYTTLIDELEWDVIRVMETPPIHPRFTDGFDHLANTMVI